tara:strand:+ start:1914 stop:2453 length:540 start_codon:yes stop_codon:yes gene_type:complete
MKEGTIVNTDQKVNTNKVINDDYGTNWTPTGSTNYYASKFHRKTKDREILFEGATPLHEFITNDLYELFFKYINEPSANTVINLTGLLPPKPPYRADTPFIIKFIGSNNKKERLKLAEYYIKSAFIQFDKIFSIFIKDTDGDIRTKIRYRSDTHKKVLIESYKVYNNTIKTQILNLLID